MLQLYTGVLQRPYFLTAVMTVQSFIQVEKKQMYLQDILTTNMHSFSRNKQFSIICHYQEVLIWLTKLSEDLGDDPSDEKVRDFIWNSLKGGVSTD